MIKKIILRGLLGFPVGIAIGYVITIVISLIWAQGYYSPCVPELAAAMGNEIYAVTLQAFLCGLLGAGCAAGSVVWETEKWSLVIQTGVYFLIISVIMMPVAYFMYWMEHSLKGCLSYFGIFALIFAIIWVIEYLGGKRNIREMNEHLYNTK